MTEATIEAQRMTDKARRTRERAHMTEVPVNGGDFARLRQLNVLSMLRTLRASPLPTLTELAERTGLSRPSAQDVIDDLIARGWVEKVQPVAGAMGRPARRYRFRAEVGHVVGIDVGAHKVLALIADLDGSIVASRRITVHPNARRAARLRAIDEAVSSVLAATGLPHKNVWGVSAASTGLVDRSGRVALSVVKDWTGTDLLGHLNRQFDCPVAVENDCRLAVLAERWRGVAYDVRDVVYVLAGTRTGAGVIINGQLLRGAHGAAGEIGLLAAAQWGTAQEHLQKWSGLPAGVAEVDIAGHVFSAARAGNRDAIQALTAYAKNLAVGTAALVLAVDPQLVVLGGGFSRSADVLLEPLRRELDKLCYTVPELRASTLGDEAPALGAIRYILDELESRLFPVDSGPASPGSPNQSTSQSGHSLHARLEQVKPLPSLIESGGALPR